MNENLTIDMEKDQESGQITYANEVISTIVSVATTEVEGIAGIVGSGSLTGLLGKGRTPRGVKVDMNGQNVSVDVSVTVDYGIPIQKVGRNVQENIRKSVESMTGLHVVKVDLHVVGVSFEKENQEMQQSQKLATLPHAEEEHPAVEEAPAAADEEQVEPELVEDEEIAADEETAADVELVEDEETAADEETDAEETEDETEIEADEDDVTVEDEAQEEAEAADDADGESAEEPEKEE